MDDFDVEFHFPYDKVRIEKVAAGDVDELVSIFGKGQPFKAWLHDYRGEQTENFEIINPSMVTHMRVTKNVPF